MLVHVAVGPQRTLMVDQSVSVFHLELIPVFHTKLE